MRKLALLTGALLGTVVSGRASANDGFVDEGNTFNSTVYLSTLEPDGASAACSGVLVTPRWVLTANHCIKGNFAHGVAPGVQFGSPHGAVAGIRAESMYLAGSPVDHSAVAVMAGLLVPTMDTEAAARDVALVKLNRRVPAAIATPFHPPTAFFECYFTASTGLIAGFGRQNPAFCDALDTTTIASDGSLRHVESIDGWSFTYMPQADGDFAIYERSTAGAPTMEPLTALISACSSYDGQAEGDSGGPLFARLPGSLVPTTLCGVASGFAPRAYSLLGMPWWWDIQNAYAATDSPSALDFINSHIRLPDGTYDGNACSRRGAIRMATASPRTATLAPR